MVGRVRTPALWIAVALAIFVTALWQQRKEPAPESRPEAAQQRMERREPVTTRPSQAASPAPATPASAATAAGETDSARPGRWARVLQVVPAGEREQLLATLALVETGGPFPYDRDGSVFSNRERRLPSRERGYYREYTVPTPGAPSRGARRIVQGKNGETWYTRDHYDSFVRIDSNDPT